MSEHFDVLVVGAGISGIGAGYYLQRDCPDRSFALLEARTDIGGTWDLFRYPGIRSDSDMHTLGYSFKPWLAEKSIADAPSILSYLNEAVDDFDIMDGPLLGRLYCHLIHLVQGHRFMRLILQFVNALVITMVTDISAEDEYCSSLRVKRPLT